MNPILEKMKQAIGLPLKESPSPMGRWLDGTLLSVEEGSLSVKYTVRKEMTNPGGILHGGAVATMLDDLMGMTVYSLGRKEFYATIQLNLDFLSPAKTGDEVIAQTQIIRAGRTVIYLEANLKNKEGKLLAKSSSNMVTSNIGYKEGKNGS